MGSDPSVYGLGDEYTDASLVPIKYQGFVADLLSNRYVPGKRIVGIDDYTQVQIIDMVNEGLRRGYSPLQIANGVEEEEYAGVASIFDDDVRVETIARTESMFAFNFGAGNSYADSGISEAEALDGVDDPECAARNGQIFTIDPDTGRVIDDNGDPVEDHPNGTLAWAPNVTDQVVATGALDDTGDVVSAEGELSAEFEAKYGTGQTNNPRGGNQHGAGPKIPRKHKHANGITHRHIGGARPHTHASGGAKPKSAEVELKYSPDQTRDDHGRFGEGAFLTGLVQAGALGGGFTIGAPKTGFQVAIPGHATTVGFATWHDTAKLAMAIHDHLAANADVYATGEQVHLGGWLSPGLEPGSAREGALIMEPSETVADQAEAFALGVARDQVSIWDNANGVEIQTGGQGAGSVKASLRDGAARLLQAEPQGTGGSGGGDGRGNAEAARSEAGLKYSADQPRDDHGRFGSGGQGSLFTPKPRQGSLRLSPHVVATPPPGSSLPTWMRPPVGGRVPEGTPKTPPAQSNPFEGKTISSSKEIGGNHVNAAYHIVFTDGTGACFKPASEQDPEAIKGDCIREAAGALIDDTIGTNLVPACVLWTPPDGAPEGLAEMGVGSAMVWSDGSSPGAYDVNEYSAQEREAAGVLDYVTQNCDRHGNNYLTGPDGELVFPDNGMSFGCNTYGQNNDRSGFQASVDEISSETIARLAAVDQEALAAQLNALGVPPAQTDLAMARLQAIIDANGDPPKGWGSQRPPDSGPQEGWANSRREPGRGVQSKGSD